MRLLTRAGLLAVAATMVQGAQADTAIGTPTSTSCTVKRGNTTIATISGGSASACRMRAASDAESRKASANYTITAAEDVGVTYIATAVQCASTQPPDDTRQTTCPAGSSGSFTQIRGYALQPSPTCWQAGTWAPTTPPAGACPASVASGSFVTTFDTAQNPLSEGGKWFRANNSWTNVKVVNGVAFGTNGVTNSYDDSYAYLTQSFGSNYQVEGVIWRDPSLPSAAANEVELLLRVSDSTSSVVGYEALWQAYGGQQIVKWNGPFGSFTVLNTVEDSYFSRPLVSGDVLGASVIGCVIQMYVNGVKTAHANDCSLASGQPGIAFFKRPGYMDLGIGFTTITVTPK